MNRAEFMRRLTELLSDVPPTERDEAIQYYNDYFDDAGAENESGVIASLGSPEELARTIKAGLSDGGNGGEFTESGFSGYTQVHKDEIIRAGEPGAEGGAGASGNAGYGGSPTGNAGNGGPQANHADYQSAYYQRTDGKGIYGGREDTRKQDNPYEQTGSGSGPASGSQQAPPPKQGMSGGMIVLITIAAVLTSPVWIGLLGGLFGLVVGIFAAVFGIFLALLIIGVVFVVVSVALLITGIALLFTVPLGGLCVIGTAFILFAAGLVSIWLMVLMAAWAIPALVNGISALGRKIFRRGGAQA